MFQKAGTTPVVTESYNLKAFSQQGTTVLIYMLYYRPVLSNHTSVGDSSPSVSTTSSAAPLSNPHSILNSLGKRKPLGLDNSDSLSLFSSINGFHGNRNPKPPVQPGMT